MDDTISRQAAIDGKISIQRSNGLEVYSDEAVPVDYLKSLPPAQPEQPSFITFDDITLYKCDPAKNISCKKSGCYVNGGPCKLTRHEEYREEYK